MPLIDVDHVSKEFPARRGPKALLGRGGMGSLLRRSRTTFTALDDIAFSVEQGESLGIIGANGSGKSTLLKVIAGVTTPTRGHVHVHGRVASLLELGAGFHPMLTGRENIYLNAGILGMRHRQVDEVFDRIVEFSGVGEFIDNPVDTYSSGMYVRIGFAVASHVNPDIFLVDEVLAVGDEEFQRKCRRRLGELHEEGKTLVFVSHDLGAVGAICDRIVLLDKGRMVVRDSPQETISFYLRRVGREKGVHVFSGGSTEVTFNNGRFSIFVGKKEVTHPYGCDFGVQVMDRWEASTQADWEVVERRPDGCVARGRMARLPVTLVCSMRLDEERLRFSFALECERDAPVDGYGANLHFPSSYRNWLYGAETGVFPEILPGDTETSLIVPPELGVLETAALPDEGSSLPGVQVTLGHQGSHVAGRWSNSEYAMGSRVLQIGARIPSGQSPLPTGQHHLMDLSINATMPQAEVVEQARRRAARRILRRGDWEAHVKRGNIALSWQSVPITCSIHVYASLLAGNLWHDSTNLAWTSFERQGDAVVARAESRRLPYGVEWQIAPGPEGFSLEMWLEASEPVDVDEYQVSVALRHEYAQWETSHENGVFPDIAAGATEWAHLNRDYAPGSRITATGPSMPAIGLETYLEGALFRMTAVNTDGIHNCRVLQALRIPEQGRIRFEPGRSLYFRGQILTFDDDAERGEE